MNNEQQIVELAKRNACALRCNGLWWHHGNGEIAGWSETIQQTWRPLEVMDEFREAVEQSQTDARNIEIVELVPGEQVPFGNPPQPVGVDWGKGLASTSGHIVTERGEVVVNGGQVRKLIILSPKDTRHDYVGTCKPDGTDVEVPGVIFIGEQPRIINTPDHAHVEEATEGYHWSIATDGEGNESIAIECNSYGWVHLLDFVGTDCYFTSRHKAEVAGWSFKAWQDVSFKHPRTVTG